MTTSPPNPDQPTLSNRQLRLIKQSTDPDWQKRIKALESMAKLDVPQTFNVIVDGLRDRIELVRVAAAEALGSRADQRAIPHLLKALADRDYEVRLTAAESLGDLISDQKSPPALVRLLEDRDALVRITAAEELEEIGDRRALPKLRQVLNDPDGLVRSYVAGAIGALGGKRDIRVLEHRLQVERSPQAKVGLLHGLYRLGKREYFPAFLKLLESKNYRVRCAVANTLPMMDLDKSAIPEARSALRRALSRETTLAAREAIRYGLRELRG